MKIVILFLLMFSQVFGSWGSNNAPVIKDPTDQTTWETDYDENNTSKITTIQADDDDGDSITYKIKDGDDGDLFDIDDSSGDLTFKNSPDYENPQDDNADNDYIVTVIADDGSDTDELKN